MRVEALEASQAMTQKGPFNTAVGILASLFLNVNTIAYHSNQTMYMLESRERCVVPHFHFACTAFYYA